MPLLSRYRSFRRDSCKHGAANRDDSGGSERVFGPIISADLLHVLQILDDPHKLFLGNARRAEVVGDDERRQRFAAWNDYWAEKSCFLVFPMTSLLTLEFATKREQEFFKPLLADCADFVHARYATTGTLTLTED